MSVQDLLPEQLPDDRTSERRTIDVVEDGTALEVLATEAAREILMTLQESPKAASEIAAETGSSIQNVCYHLDRLQRAGLIEVAGTRHSSKAKEMDIYVPTSESIVVRFGTDQFAET
ncbi:ArsR family transcription regulator [Natronomonas moolapensis 8.8.11]|jgi:predicted transcriptional regulator|uniref:ArsR family transcription regulator n=1 Tax=Natronomonas moolapensis (strain DSM 18674 / CECT 7526 / JCM 14361 / 8.8.11) TaxID=268739 RepID=M1Y416_NATM8|nr:winged helix-turn-helix domain-containing protein [Natronomonas moolapensis]CCQ37264.1 ArsR family transcription regulator [Natronomonas moolapensis 8.8.11]